jgi:hypothetical protein
MGVFRYIVQGFGWEIGREAAREGIDALEQHEQEREPEAPPPSARDLAKLAKARAKDEAHRRAEIERQLAQLKKKAER